MSNFELKPAQRKGIKPLVSIYGKSNGGKTFSALMVARGFVGPNGRIGLADTEEKRAEIIADCIPGGFSHIDFQPPFTPERYIEVIELMEQKCDIGIIDSLSHEWSGEDGILEMQEAELQRMAGDDFKKRDACKMAAWIKPKLRHKALIQKILRCKIPLIVCLRGEEKTRLGKKDGKTTVEKDEFSSPLFDPRFIFECTINVELVNVGGNPGCAYVTKWTHAGIRDLMPKDGEQIGAKHGEALAKWCNDPSGSVAVSAPSNPQSEVSVDGLKKELWTLTKSVHKNDKAKLESWLTDEMLLDPSATLSDLNEKELQSIINKVKAKGLK